MMLITRSLLLIAGLMFASIGIRAQTAFGLKAGLTGSNIRVTGTTNPIISATKTRYAPHLGLWTNIRLGRFFFVQPELLYLDQGFSTRYQDLNGNQQQSVTRLQHISLPLLLGFHVNRLHLAAGPEVSYLFRARLKTVDYEINAPIFGAGEWSLNANLDIGYRIDRWGFSLRGSLGLSPQAEIELVDVNGVALGLERYYIMAIQAAASYQLSGR